MFDGIDDEILGDFGLSGGGAAGYELDRVDHVLGSPDNIRIVATSENHGDTYVVVPEELLTHVSTVTGETPDQLIRADMVLLRHAERRRGILHRLDHVLRKSPAQRFRQQYFQASVQCGSPFP